jgi:glycosyltransferase involved in cell wall biosynthesis
MKVVQVATGIYPTPSSDRAAAIEKIVYELSLNLSKKGCDVHVIDIPSKKRKLNKIIFHEAHIGYFASMHHRNFSALAFSFFSVFTLLNIFKKTRVDVVHTHYPYSGLLCMLVCRLFRNVCHVHTTHNPYLVMYASSLKRFSEVIALKYSNHIVAETFTVKEQLVYRFKIPSEKITIIPSGVEEPVVMQNTFGSSESIILSVGRISSRKNQLTLVKAIPHILATHPKVKFIFAGPIEDKLYFQKIIDFIERRNISRFVEFTGEIPREKLNALYNQATIFAFPTIAEIQGLVLLEAMSYGLPVIASRIGPIMDIAGKFPNSALLVDQDSESFAKSINKLLDDNALRFELSQNARKLASAFSWNAVASRILVLYGQLTLSIENNQQGKAVPAHT